MERRNDQFPNREMPGRGNLSQESSHKLRSEVIGGLKKHDLTDHLFEKAFGEFISGLWEIEGITAVGFVLRDEGDIHPIVDVYLEVSSDLGVALLGQTEDKRLDAIEDLHGALAVATRFHIDTFLEFVTSDQLPKFSEFRLAVKKWSGEAKRAWVLACVS